jgi:hypothetical protein
MQDAAAETRRTRKGVVDMQRIEIADQLGPAREVRIGDGDFIAEGIADPKLGKTPAVVFARLRRRRRRCGGSVGQGRPPGKVQAPRRPGRGR